MNTDDAGRRTTADENQGRGPLAGMLILDMTRALSGPYCSMLLQELGARVIKVEPPGGDESRVPGPFVDGMSAYFSSINRGKESIVLDLKNAADREVFESMMDRADVLLENYRPDVMERLGYTWEAIHARNPRLVYAAISGFGHYGPHRLRPAYDMVVQAMGGLMSITGYPGQPPARVGVSIGDIAAGLFTAGGINAALLERERTGEGGKVDVAMLDCQLALLENPIARFSANGEVPQPAGASHTSIAPFGVFQTRDQPIVICAGFDEPFRRLAGAVGLPALAQDPRFASSAQRVRNKEALQQALEHALRQDSAGAWLDKLQQCQIPCGPLNSVEQILADPHVEARSMLVSLPARGGKTLRVAGNPIKLSGLDERPTRAAAPELDGDRQALLREFGASVNGALPVPAASAAASFH